MSDAVRCPEWSIIYDGYGSVSCTGNMVALSPKSAGSPDETHAGLATSRTKTVPQGEVTVIDANVRTVEQLREGSDPNAWEVAWLLWNYQDNNHFYALVLKPNGWEVSKQDPAYPGSQRFIASGSTPTFAVGTDHHVRLSIDTTSGSAVTTTISVDGKNLVTATDTDTPYTSGAVAAYTEDAQVEITLDPPATQ